MGLLWRTVLQCAVCTLLVQISAAQTTNFAQVQLTSTDPKAVCNDGSPGMFYYRPGSGTGAKKWVVRLEGGGWCSDAATCATRLATTPTLMSTAGFPPALAAGAVVGVLNNDPAGNPSMYNWNHVSATYCSSDSFLGDAGPTDSPQAGAYQFRGKRIITAVVRSLIATYNITSATDILVTGESAGGVAVMNNAAMIKEMVAPKSTSLKTFKCLVDAGWFLDIPSYSTAVNAWTFRSNAQGLQQNWNATFDKNCTAVYGASQAWMCFFAQYAWPYIPVPLLFHEFLYDSANLNFDSAASPEEVDDFSSKLATTLTTPASKIVLPQNITAPPSLNAAAKAGNISSLSFLATPQELPSVFAPALTEHTIVDNLFFSTDSVGSSLFTTVLNNWFTGVTNSVSTLAPSTGGSSN